MEVCQTLEHHCLYYMMVQHLCVLPHSVEILICVSHYITVEQGLICHTLPLKLGLTISVWSRSIQYHSLLQV
jgi:hypothetical protein